MEPVSKAVQRTQPLESSGTLLQTQCQKKRDFFFFFCLFQKDTEAFQAGWGFFFHCWCFFFFLLPDVFICHLQTTAARNPPTQCTAGGRADTPPSTIHPSIPIIHPCHPSLPTPSREVQCNAQRYAQPLVHRSHLPRH